VLAVGAAIAFAVVAFFVWFLIIRDTSPASVDSRAASDARQQALDEAGDTGTEPAGSEGLDGLWTVDTSIGSFDEACLSDVCNTSFAGFRIDEVLARFGAKTVVGRSPGVSGSLEIAGATITNVDIVVDMTQLITDDDRRTNAIRSQAIETGAFPEASFVLSSPIQLGSIPAEGESVTVQATGELTIRGVTRTETIDLTAELSGGVIVVFGQLGPILLADFDIDKPQAAIVLSVEDNAIMELQLFFTQQ